MHVITTYCRVLHFLDIQTLLTLWYKNPGYVELVCSLQVTTSQHLLTNRWILPQLPPIAYQPRTWKAKASLSSCQSHPWQTFLIDYGTLPTESAGKLWVSPNSVLQGALSNQSEGHCDCLSVLLAPKSHSVRPAFHRSCK